MDRGRDGLFASTVASDFGPVRPSTAPGSSLFLRFFLPSAPLDAPTVELASPPVRLSESDPPDPPILGVNEDPLADGAQA